MHYAAPRIDQHRTHPNRRTGRGRRSRTFTVAQTAAVLGISRAETMRLIRCGAVPAQRQGRRIAVIRSSFAFLLVEQM